MRTREAVIVEAIRTPIGKRNGALAQTLPADLAALVLQRLVERTQIDPAVVEDVIMGCVSQVGEQGANIGRIAALTAGFPVQVPATTINRMCGSSQQAVHFAAQAIISGFQDVVIASGVECMSRVPLASDFPAQFSEKLTTRHEIVSQGISAEIIAERWGLGREELDRFSCESHMKAARATREGRFEREMISVEVSDANGATSLLTKDEGIRAETSVEALSKLKPAFKANGVIHAGNASQISDGAAALLLMERQRAETLGYKPLAKVVGMAVVGDDPKLMLTGPIPATRKVLATTGLTLEDMDAIEINEAFASVVLAWAKELEPRMERVNRNGGAIALGHPTGASGARIMATLIHDLHRTKGRYGLQTMCIGHGMATATIIERV